MGVTEVMGASTGSPTPADDSPELRVLAAARVAFCRWGVRRSSMDDVARLAGLSRATAYRLVPGGKDALAALVLSEERSRLVRAVEKAAADADDLESLLVGVISAAGRWLAANDLLQALCANEPELVLPHVAFGAADRLLAEACLVLVPLLEPHLEPGRAPVVAEWVARVVLSHALAPSPFVALADTESVRRLVTTLLLPALLTTRPSEDLP